MKERERDTSARGADRMSERDRATVDKWPPRVLARAADQPLNHDDSVALSRFNTRALQQVHKDNCVEMRRRNTGELADGGTRGR